MVPSLKTTALILLETFLIECYTALVEPPMTSSLKIQKREYLWNAKRYSKKENAILLYSEKPFKSAKIIFYFIGTLKIPVCLYNLAFQSGLILNYFLIE